MASPNLPRQGTIRQQLHSSRTCTDDASTTDDSESEQTIYIPTESQSLNLNQDIDKNTGGKVAEDGDTSTTLHDSRPPPRNAPQEQTPDSCTCAPSETNSGQSTSRIVTASENTERNSSQENITRIERMLCQFTPYSSFLGEQSDPHINEVRSALQTEWLAVGGLVSISLSLMKEAALPSQ